MVPNAESSSAVGTSISESFPIENGVRQGGILSPNLFNFYIDALSTRLNSIPAGCKIGNLMVNHLAYADDLVLLCPSLKGLQRLVHECQIYGINNDITYNCNKTVCMSLLSRKFTISSKPSIVLFSRQMRSFYIRSNYLVRTCSCSNCSVEVKSQLLSAYCSRMYCAALWCNFKKYTIRKLTVAYNNILEDPCFCRNGAVPVECLFTVPLILLVNFGVNLLYLLGIGW